MRLLLASLFVMTAFSGCLAGTELVDAQDLLGEARSHARTMMPGAQLAGIAGWEPFSHVSEDGFEANIYVDSVQADGKAPGWMYLFTDGSEVVGVAVAAGLGVLGDFRTADEEMPALDSWSVGSVAAARALGDDPRWPDVDEGTSTTWMLHQGEEGPVWTVELYQSDSWTGGSVDARTGEVLAIEDEDGYGRAEVEVPMEGVLFEASGSVTGGVSPGPFVGSPWCEYGCIEVPFALDQWAEVHIDLRWDLGANDFDLVVMDAEGNELGSSGNSVLVTSEELMLDLAPGEYTVGIVPFVVVADTYTVQGRLV